MRGILLLGSTFIAALIMLLPIPSAGGLGGSGPLALKRTRISDFKLAGGRT
jgi:hypothetical protein